MQVMIRVLIQLNGRLKLKNNTMKSKHLFISSLMLLGIMLFMLSCIKDESDSGSSLRILKTPLGLNQRVIANIDDGGNATFNAQTILADGGNPLHNYDWSLDLSSNPPSGVTIGALTGVINRIGTSGTGLNVGITIFKVIVSDGSSTATGEVELKVLNETPGFAFEFQHSGFQLIDGEANKPYGASLFALGGIPPYQWILDPSYPGSVDLTNAGLIIEGTAGIVRGTILNSASGETINFKVIVTDNIGQVAMLPDNSSVYTITIK
jgi:hypothetical protein